MGRQPSAQGCGAPTLLASRRPGVAFRLTATRGAMTMRTQRCDAIRDASPWRKHRERLLRAEALCRALHPSRRGHLSVLRARLLQRPRRSPGRRAGDMQPLSLPAEARRPGEAPALQGLRPAAERRASVWRTWLPGHTHRTMLTVPRLLLQPPPGRPRHVRAGRTSLGTPPCLCVRALLATTTPLVAGLTCLDN